MEATWCEVKIRFTPQTGLSATELRDELTDLVREFGRPLRPVDVEITLGQGVPSWD